MSSSVYDAYGAETTSGTAPTDACGYNAQWGYWLDRDTGLNLCQARWYDPVTGRWVTRDPIGYAGGANLYGYCGGGPVGWSDISGNGKASVLIRVLRFIGANFRVPGGYLTVKQAANHKRKGGQILVEADSEQEARRVALEIAEKAHPGQDVLEHLADDHPQPVGTPLPHFQVDGETGHVFYRPRSPSIAIPLADLGDRLSDSVGGVPGSIIGTIVDCINPIGDVEDISNFWLWLTTGGLDMDAPIRNWSQDLPFPGTVARRRNGSEIFN